jgi:hypothetical protein
VKVEQQIGEPDGPNEVVLNVTESEAESVSEAEAALAPGRHRLNDELPVPEKLLKKSNFFL